MPHALSQRENAREPTNRLQKNQHFPCDKCDMIARSKTGLKSHIRAKHPENPEKIRTSPSAHPTTCFSTLRILPTRLWQHRNARMPQRVQTSTWNSNSPSNNTSNVSTK
ncbi:uncharacterized protein TM35_000062980 [Trypanosoma theileri]|uniref:C2H2-type domain-containing protein n=1 Tax=Trypanosoma theileri TaxID=67003 RepID=A0A1X0P3M5_9TRYP|nr:uncharacterized protein TM35_000062980 [Trypanosoma theileri]ORC91293.1 hypothetical protein TM35_000062980 [Trypanosoma theileri]